MIGVSINGFIFKLNNEDSCSFCEFVRLLGYINDTGNIKIKIQKIHKEDRKIYYLIIENENKMYTDIIDIRFMTQYEVFRYLERYIKLDDLIEIEKVEVNGNKITIEFRK